MKSSLTPIATEPASSRSRAARRERARTVHRPLHRQSEFHQVSQDAPQRHRTAAATPPRRRASRRLTQRSTSHPPVLTFLHRREREAGPNQPNAVDRRVELRAPIGASCRRADSAHRPRCARSRRSSRQSSGRAASRQTFLRTVRGTARPASDSASRRGPDVQANRSATALRRRARA